MDPITLIVTALVAGAAVAAKDVGGQALKDVYAGFKALVIRKFGGKGGGQAAVEQVEQTPDSQPWQGALKDALSKTDAANDNDLAKQAQALLALLKQHDAGTVATYSATVIGSGGLAQGTGAVAAGAGGIAIGGGVGGGVSLGGPRPDDNPAPKPTDKPGG
jgi:hypothetical protein